MTMLSRAHKRMNRTIADRLTDGVGSFHTPEGQRITGLQLAVDSTFQLSGVMETLTGNIKAVTAPKTQMQGLTPARGDWFEMCGKKYLVEDTLSDDQYFPTYACQEVL